VARSPCLNYVTGEWKHITYLYGTTTALVHRKDITHMAFCRFGLFERGWTDHLIK